MELRYSQSHSSAPPHVSFTNTAKLPIETVKRLIAAVSRRPTLWLRQNTNGQKRSDITPIWFEVGQDVNLPADVCRIKWGHLRDNFRKVFIRNNLTNEGPSSWRFYNDMRFMERAVAENIMRQTKSSKKRTPGHWSENNNLVVAKFELNDASVPICELSDSYEELHRPSFSDITSFFEDRDSQSATIGGKRLKMEPAPSNGTEEEDSSNHEDELNDDDFDEDAASETEDAKRTQTVDTTDAGVFTIEVLDDDEEEPPPKKPKSSPSNDSKRDSAPNDLPFKYMSVDAASNTEPAGGGAAAGSGGASVDGLEADDADRMFLLSLLPFLQKVEERRKLRVRQQLQSVLIEELEFG